jgi:F-type H+-transporting ATPase subunit gamma
MRGIAASRSQTGRSVLAGIEGYTAIVSQAIGVALNLLRADVTAAPAPGCSKRGLILFCAEQGFAGSFSERVFDAAGGDLNRAASLVVGTRGAAVARERGIKPDWWTPTTTRIDGIPGFAGRLADALYGYIARGIIVTADILFSRSTSGGIVIDRHSLLPIDFKRFARPLETQTPLITLAPELLLERLAAEYVYAQLCEAAMHAFAAENEARMIAMLAAKNNTEAKLAALFQRERQLRQEEITTEIIELAAGAEALRNAPSSSA